MINIDLDKKDQIQNQAKNKIESMSNKMDKICQMLFGATNGFDGKCGFDEIHKYILEYDRLLYNNISNNIFQSETDEAFSAFQSNIDCILNYAYSDEFEERIAQCKNDSERSTLSKSRKVLIKIYDHVNLANRQFVELKETDDEYNKKFKRNISSFQQEVTKEMSNQLVTLVGIFTAIAFVVFGGISYLDNIFEGGMSNIYIIRLMILGTMWSLCMTNLLFIFLFCVGKITKLKFGSSRNSSDNLIKKYPIIFWSNFIFLSILIVMLWINYLSTHGLLQWINNIGAKDDIAFSVIGSVLIIIVIIVVANMLIEKRKPEKENHIEI